MRESNPAVSVAEMLWAMGQLLREALSGPVVLPVGWPPRLSPQTLLALGSDSSVSPGVPYTLLTETEALEWAYSRNHKESFAAGIIGDEVREVVGPVIWDIV